jgi:hypothetical protein
LFQGLSLLPVAAQAEAEPTLTPQGLKTLVFED